MNFPASQRVISIPELLVGILRHSSSRDNASNFLVCKNWLNEVLNIEWRVVNRPKRLFGLLAPLARRRDGGMEGDDEIGVDSGPSEMYFTREITRDDTERFKRYARRVHSLHLNFYDDDKFRPLFDVLSKIWPLFEPGPPLPNLRGFVGPFNMHVLQLFVHPSLLNLMLYDGTEPIDLQSFRSAFSYIANTTPSLQALDISGISPADDLQTTEPIVLATFRSLRALQKLVIPRNWLTPSVSDTLAGLSDLRILDASASRDWAIPPSDPSLTFSEQLTPEAFPSLQQLELTISFRRALSCFTSKLEFPTLQRFVINSMTPESPLDYKRILEMVSRCFPLLADVEIGVLSNNPVMQYHEGHPEIYVRYEELSPILSLKNLRSISLNYPTPFQLDALEVKSFPDTLNHLSSISLNPRPLFRSPTTLPLFTLATLSNSVRPLQRISLYVDTSPNFILPEDHEMQQLKGLQYLSLGRSALAPESIEDVSLFLSRVLPYTFNVHTSFYNSIGVNYDSWSDACDLIPKFMKAILIGEDRAARRQQEKEARKM